MPFVSFPICVGRCFWFFYNVVHGQLTCSILAEATASVAIGTEFEFFQSSSAGTFLFEKAALVNVYSKSDAMKITGQYSAATFKKSRW